MQLHSSLVLFPSSSLTLVVYLSTLHNQEVERSLGKRLELPEPLILFQVDSLDGASLVELAELLIKGVKEGEVANGR